MPNYRLLRTDPSVDPRQRLRRFEADSDRAALLKARELVQGGAGELWLGDELVCKIGG
jgi:hypothetical protein